MCKKQESILGATLVAIVLAAHGLAAATTTTARAQAPMTPIPIPAQVPAKEALVSIPDTQLWTWDTGGSGAPVVFLHPATGSALIWGYQQPVFAAAGYRVIAFSRRGYFNSAAFDKSKPGIGADDLRHLADQIGIGRFHLVASAAGGSIAADFALSHQDRLLSLTISSNALSVRDGEIAKAAAAIRPKGFDEMPPEFREIGPSYRAANPEGVKAWLELEHKALIGRDFQQPRKNTVTVARLKDLKLPTLLISGVADLYTPPSITRMIGAEIPGSKVVVVPEAGHSIYWEQPEIFNRTIIDFVSRVPR